MYKNINIGIIGYGYWGKNLARNFANIQGVKLRSICDLSLKNLQKAKSHYSSIEVTNNFWDILNDVQIAAVVIATPTSTHFDLAMEALKVGKHVLVEKPLADTLEKAKKIVLEAEKRNSILMVDHTFVYTSAVRKLHKLIGQNKLGEIYYYDSVRVNLGKFQPDVNVLWDLAVHDLSIMDYVLPFQPYAVSATGMSHVLGNPENTAYLSLFFQNNIIAHIHTSWLSPIKLRRTLIGGDSKMLVYDDLEPNEKIKVYNKGIKVDRNAESCSLPIGYRIGDMRAPKLDKTEALWKMGWHFVRCIKKEKNPISDGNAGLRVIKILEAATKSIAQKGRLIEL